MRRLSIRLTLAPLAALLVAACADAPEPAAASAAARDSATLSMGDDGVARLGAATPFDTAAVRAALPPGFAVEVRSVETEAGRVPVLWALRDGLLVLEVFPDAAGRTVARIDAANDQVSGPGDIRTGQSFADLKGGAMDCEPGDADLAGRVVCRAGRGEPVRYVFAHGGAADSVPDDDQLATAMLERMVWTAE